MSSSNDKKGGKAREKSQLYAASDVLQSLLQNNQSAIGQEFTRWRLWNKWSDVVGESMAKYSIPVGYRKGVLYVWVQDSVHLQEMTFMVRALRERINSFVGRAWIRSIRLTLDRKDVPTAQETEEDLREYLSK